MRYPAGAVISRLRHPSRSRQPVPTYVATLEPGEQAWDPTSTKRVITGPAEVTYLLHPDGGIEAVVRAAGSLRPVR